eukprot:m.295275 g.295275  ORF g.295275 m.295275 type:complete len:111 (-) comp55146_c0_seq7:963-1295(-)
MPCDINQRNANTSSNLDDLSGWFGHNCRNDRLDDIVDMNEIKGEGIKLLEVWEQFPSGCLHHLEDFIRAVAFSKCKLKPQRRPKKIPQKIMKSLQSSPYTWCNRKKVMGT